MQQNYTEGGRELRGGKNREISSRNSGDSHENLLFLTHYDFINLHFRLIIFVRKSKELTGYERFLWVSSASERCSYGVNARACSCLVSCWWKSPELPCWLPCVRRVFVINSSISRPHPLSLSILPSLSPYPASSLRRKHRRRCTCDALSTEMNEKLP